MALDKYIDLDFAATIDSDDDSQEISNLEESDDEARSSEIKTKSRTSKNTRAPIEVTQKDLNESFQFDIDNCEVTESFKGWDFVGDDKENQKGYIRNLDVDLNKIIRRKGGLLNIAHISEDESSSHISDDSSDNDEDDLAMDGFGMGVQDENLSSDLEIDGEVDEADVEKEIEGRGSKPSHSETTLPQDTEEEMAKFYAPDSEIDTTKKQSHETFASLSLSRPLLKALSSLNYTKPSKIQSATIPIALMNKDIVAGAVTGSGKTAAYMIPIIERLLYKPSKLASTRVIVLTPTRELAIQVADVGKQIARFTPSISFGLAVGGLNLRQQEQMLKARPDVVIATPGRFIDHIRNSASFNVDSVEILVIDEADRMLEEGFHDELTEIMSLLPTKRQTLLFSATMNTNIKQLISLSLKRPVRIMIDPPKQTAVKLIQEFVRVRKRDNLKPALLFNLLRKLDPRGQRRIVVFVSRKELAHRLRIIMGLLGMNVAELHGSLSQEQRLDSVTKFKTLEVPVLLCTDLAARGLDIPKIEVVINYDMPKTYEIYLHRVGRTARAGRDGRSITFVGESSLERSIVREAIAGTEGKNSRGKALGRNVDWKNVEETAKLIENMAQTVDDVLLEEKEEKEILRAEMELKKSENLLKHSKEIQSRPKRTWFQTEKDKKILRADSGNTFVKKANSKQRKRDEAKTESTRFYKKTKHDRHMDQERAYKKQKKTNRKGVAPNQGRK